MNNDLQRICKDVEELLTYREDPQQKEGSKETDDSRGNAQASKGKTKADREMILAVSKAYIVIN